MVEVCGLSLPVRSVSRTWWLWLLKTPVASPRTSPLTTGWASARTSPATPPCSGPAGPTGTPSPSRTGTPVGPCWNPPPRNPSAAAAPVPAQQEQPPPHIRRLSVEWWRLSADRRKALFLACRVQVQTEAPKNLPPLQARQQQARRRQARRWQARRRQAHQRQAHQRQAQQRQACSKQNVCDHQCCPQTSPTSPTLIRTILKTRVWPCSASGPGWRRTAGSVCLLFVTRVRPPPKPSKTSEYNTRLHSRDWNKRKRAKIHWA